MIRVAINGYGRIGRVAHRVILDRFTDQIEIVAINGGDSTDIRGWAYLLKYDTAYGLLAGHKIEGIPAVGDQVPKMLGHLVVDGNNIPFYTEKSPAVLPWKALSVDVVIECTGAFTTEEKIKPHLISGAKKVVLSAPAKDHTIKTYVLDVNVTGVPGEDVISNASCTTNCIAPVAQIMVAKFGVFKAMMTTMHAYTSDQRLQDGGHDDYRRARAAAQNIVLTTTGAAIAAAEAVPELAGLFTGVAVRVPVIVGSLSDFTFHLKRETTVDEVNKVLTEAANSDRYKHILEVSKDPLVSSDIIGNPHSAIVDLPLTQVVGGDMVKVFAWYDNEWGYANRLVEEVLLVGQAQN
ncbi:type I glyceraldehyde-3-phosphate dehydrogenase [Candidatus Microgenomates bacterium]|nr:type I glyceraldehyde-3-phosphate dehydrogenase [Candidatus Microgenomates bacterium]